MAIQADIIEEILYREKDFKRNNLERNFSVRTTKALHTHRNKRIIRGIASTSHKDRVEDIITFSALKKAEKDLMKDGTRTVFFNHNRDMPIGKVLVSNAIKGKGLEITVQLSKAKDVDDIFTKIKEGVLNSLSIGGRFKRVRIERDEDGSITSFKVLEIELFEVSVVGLPANPKARITSVSGKSLRGWTKMLKGIELETPAINNERGFEMGKKKSKKGKGKETEKKVDDEDEEDDDNDNEGNEEDTLTEKKVKEMIGEVVTPLADGIKTLTTTIADFVKNADEDEEDDEDDNEDEEDDEEKEKKKSVKKKKKSDNGDDKHDALMAEIKKLSGEVANIKKDKNRRKGYTADDEDDDEEGNDVVKKALKNVDDNDTLKYIAHIYHDAPEEFDKLTDGEKKKAKEIYFELMAKGWAKD